MTDHNGDPAAADGSLEALLSALDGDGGSDPDARLELLRRLEAGIASELDGLDGL